MTYLSSDLGGTISLQNELIRILNGNSIQTEEPITDSNEHDSNIIDTSDPNTSNTEFETIDAATIVESSLSSNLTGGQSIQEMIDATLGNDAPSQKSNSFIESNQSASTHTNDLKGGNITETTSTTKTAYQINSNNANEEDIFGQIYADSKESPTKDSQLDENDFKLDDVPNGDINKSDDELTMHIHNDNNLKLNGSNVFSNFDDSNSDDFNSDSDDSDNSSDSESNDNEFAHKYIKIIDELKEAKTNNSLSLRGAGTINKRVRIINAFPYIIKSSTTE